MRVPIRRFSSTDSRHAEIRHAVHNSWWRSTPAGSSGRLIAATLDSRFIRQACAFHISRCKQSRPIATSIRRSGFTTTKENCGCRCEAILSDILSRIPRVRGIDESMSAIKVTKSEEIRDNMEFKRETNNTFNLLES